MLVLLDEIISECEASAICHVLVTFCEIIVVYVFVGTCAKGTFASAGNGYSEPLSIEFTTHKLLFNNSVEVFFMGCLKWNKNVLLEDGLRRFIRRLVHLIINMRFKKNFDF